MKKFLSLFLIFLLAFTVPVTGAFSLYSQTDETVSEEEITFDGTNFHTFDSEGSEIDTGFYPIKVGASAPKKTKKAQAGMSQSTVPSYYNLMEQGRCTSVKTQNFGDCWSHAVVSSLESNALTKGINGVDFSESHLCWFTLNPLTEGFKPADVWNAGANQRIAVFSLANLQGIANETDFPMQSKENVSLMEYDESYRYNRGSGFIIDSSVILTDMDMIKQWIMQNGEAYVNILAKSAGMKHSSKYGTYMMYYPVSDTDTVKSNHAVTLVGWDDSVSASDFTGSYKPTHDGAWIIKNSSGDGVTCNLLSYDQFINESCGFTIRPYTEKLNDYTHSPGGYGKFIGVDSSNFTEGANIFKAKSKENISSVSFFINQTNQSSNGNIGAKVTVKVYRNLPSDYTTPTAGTLSCTYTTNFDKFGYYTVDLPQPVPVEKDEIFAVSFSIESANIHRICVEKNGVFNETTYSSEARQSYVRYSKTSKFSDIRSSTTGNIFMHVYTTDRNEGGCEHELISHEGKAATCTEGGWEPYFTCSKCDYTTYKATCKLGHSLTYYDAKPATCTQGGWDAYEACSRCDYTTFSATDKLGHDYVWVYNNNATTREDGTETEVCTRCKVTRFERTKEGSKLPPNSNAVIFTAKAARVDYRSTVTITAQASGLDEGYHLEMKVGDRTYQGTATSVSACIGEIQDDVEYTVSIVKNNGEATGISKSGGKITCSKGFFKKLIAFFRSIFGTLPETEIAYDN